MNQSGSGKETHWKRRVLLAATPAFVLLSLAVLLQNNEGLFLRYDKTPSQEEIRKQEGRAFRIPIRSGVEPTSEKLIHESQVFESGERLEKLWKTKNLKHEAGGVFTTTDNGIWVMPKTGDVRNLVLRIPRSIPWWMSFPLYGLTLLLVAVHYRSGETRRFLNRVDVLSRGRLREGWSLVCRYPFALVIVAILVSLLAFQKFILEDVAPYYPRHHDQNHYLIVAHHYGDFIRDHGWWATFASHFFDLPSNDPFRLSPNANLSFLVSGLIAVFGNDRIVALSLHFFSWALLLATLYWCFRRIAGHHAYGWLAVGTLLFTNMPLVGAGGIADFRLDFVAACWMGISVAFWCLFLYQPKSIYAWLGSTSVAFLIFVRIISAASIGVPLAFVLGVAVVSALTGKRKELRRAIGPLVAVGVWTILLVAVSHRFIREYYVDLSLDTELASRGADETWSNGAWEAIRFYPETLLFSHFGPAALVILLLTVVGSAGYSRWLRRESGRPANRNWKTAALIFSALAVILPLVVLTANPHRVSHVVGIAVPPLLVFGMLLAVPPRKFAGRGPIVLYGLLILVAGTLTWGSRLRENPPFPKETRRQAEVINKVFAEVTFSLRDLPRPQRKLAVLDFWEASGGAWFYGRERLNSRNFVSCNFPNQIAKMETEEILSRVGEASAVIAPRDPSILAARPYHISESMHESFDETMDLVRSKLPYHSSFSYEGEIYDLYLRSNSPKLEITDGGTDQ